MSDRQPPRPYGRAGRAREQAENAERRAEKRRTEGGPPCPGGAGQQLADLFRDSRLQWDRSDALGALAADRSATACESMASVHERLAKAGSRDAAAYCRRIADYRAAAVLFRLAAAAFRAATG